MRLYFLLEFVANGSLYDLLKRETTMSYQLARHVSGEIVLAL